MLGHLGILSFFVTYVSCCHSGWTLKDNSCYHVSRDAATWVEALRMCEIHGSTLAHIETSAEQSFINSLVENLKGAGHEFWLSGSDWNTEGEWVWEPEGTQVNYTNWIKGQPDNYYHKEHCLSMDRNHHGQWNDKDCHTTLHYLCEEEQDKPVTDAPGAQLVG